MQLFQILVPMTEIAIIAVVLYYLLSFFWNTRAMDLILGMLAFLGLFAIAHLLNLPVLQRLMFYVVNVAAIAVLIIFQPELRLALMRLSVKGKKYHEVTEFDRFLDSICSTVYRLAERRIGALVLLENQDSLEEYANQAIRLDAGYSPELLESIFATHSPLHDGAVLIRGTTILAAAVILPLADDSSQLARSMGTRHRAALGMSQVTDALIIIVSEQTGRVSIARDGLITRGIKTDRFRGIVRSIFTPPKVEVTPQLSWLKRLKQWMG